MSSTRLVEVTSPATSPSRNLGKSKAVLIGAVPPITLETETNPGGLPIMVFDGFSAALASNRAQLFLDLPTGPFYGFNRPGAQISEGVIRNWCCIRHWPGQQSCLVSAHREVELA